LLVVLLFASGLALLANAVVLTCRHAGRLTFVTAGLLFVVALDLTLVAALASPFAGPVEVAPTPLAEVLADLENQRIG
jgi:hypothetical protein